MAIDWSSATEAGFIKGNLQPLPVKFRCKRFWRLRVPLSEQVQDHIPKARAVFANLIGPKTEPPGNADAHARRN